MEDKNALSMTNHRNPLIQQGMTSYHTHNCGKFIPGLRFVKDTLVSS